MRRLVLGLAMVVSAAVQAATVKPADPKSDREIVVTGKTEERSPWKRAETDHVVVYSEGSEGELKRVARNLETLHQLMTRLYRRGDTSDNAAKLAVTLVESQARLAGMQVLNLWSQEGPYDKAFMVQHVYEPRETGDMIAVTRSDQLIDLNTTYRDKKDCLELDQDTENAPLTCGEAATYRPPIALSWEPALYAAFARHFLLTYLPAAYPRWYLDGLGALFSTVKITKSGAVDYAGPPDEIKRMFGSFKMPNFAAILAGRYPASPSDDGVWSPYSAWLMTHYFVYYAKLKPERHQQFDAYMAAVARGVPLAEAAAVFGDLKRLNRDISGYAEAQFAYSHAGTPQTPIAEPLVSTLSRSSGALVEARVEMESRLASPGSRAADWLAGFDDRNSNESALLVAEGECRTGQSEACLAAAQTVLARSPDDAAALAWKGMALTSLAVAGPAEARAGKLAEARKAIAQAIAVDGTAPLPLIAYFESFAKTGEPVPDDAMRDMALAIRAVPAAPAPRLELARELVRQGHTDLAQRVLQPVLYGGYDSPEKGEAQRLFASAAH